jgi:hypothetical protein
MVRYYVRYSNVSRGKRQKNGDDDVIPCILETEGNMKSCRHPPEAIAGRSSTIYRSHPGKKHIGVTVPAIMKKMANRSIFLQNDNSFSSFLRHDKASWPQTKKRKRYK